MRNINILILDNEEKYVKKFLEFFSSSERANNYSVVSTVNHEQATDIVENQEIDILVANKEFLGNSFVSVVPLVLLLDDGTARSEFDFPAIKKYQSLSKLEQNILQYFLEQDSEAEYFLKQPGKARILTAFSLNNPTDKTIYLLNLGNELQLQGYRVLYLNMEMLHSTNLFLETPENNEPTSEIIYYVQRRSHKILAQLKKYFRIDMKTNISYFSFINNPVEMLEFSADDVEFLLDAIKSGNDFDFVLIDVDVDSHERNKKILSMSDRILMLIDNDSPSVQKNNVLCTFFKSVFGIELKSNEKVIKILDKVKPEESVKIVEADGALPFIEEWNPLLHPKNIYDNRNYGKAVIQSILKELEYIEKSSSN